MNRIYLSTAQLIFVIVVPIVVVIVLIIFGLIPLLKHLRKAKYREYYYKTVRKIALNQDYYLINQFVFPTDDNHKGIIDHVLFGDKYIYVISSAYYPGDLTGQIFDQSLILIPKKGRKKYVSNPILQNKKLLTRLSMMLELDQDLLIGISITNDDVNLDIKGESKQFYAIQRNKLPALVKAIESRNIPTINEEQLARAVQGFDKMKQKYKKKHEK